MCKSESNDLGIVDSEIFAIAAGIVQSDTGNVRVEIHNNTDEVLELPRNIQIGTFESVAASELIPLDKLTRKDIKHPLTNLTPNKKAVIDEQLRVSGSTDFISKLRQLLYQFHDIVSTTPQDLGLTREVKHEVHMKTKEPVHIPQFRIPEEHLEALNKHVDDLLKSGCIVRSASPFNSPIFLLKKPSGGGLRVLQDFRAVNEASYDNKYSIKEFKSALTP
jgi:hypothetical protein